MLDGRLAAPALVVSGLRLLGVGCRADDGADLGLLVALHRGLLAAAVLLAPYQLHFRAERNVGIDDAEREHRALVVAVAAEHVEPDQLAVARDLVVGSGRVIRK